MAAKECLKPLTASKKYSDNLRFKALALRSNISLEEKAYARAIADLEKIMAENSQISGIREAIANVHQSRDEAEQQKAQEVSAKTAETLRVREEKAAEAQRLREAKAAETLRLSEAQTAAKRTPKVAPVIQTGVINLSDDFVEEAAATNDRPTANLTVNTAKEAGFYPDPEGIAPYRYWDGDAWTSRVRMAK